MRKDTRGTVGKQILLFVLCCVSANAYAHNCWRCDWHGQDDARGRLTLNLNVGTTYSYINQLYSAVEPLAYRPNYTYEIKGKFSPILSVGLDYGINICRLSFQSSYTTQGASIERFYSSYADRFDVNYHFLNFGVGIECLMYKGLYMGAMTGYGVNLAGKGVHYSNSNKYKDTSVEESVFKGKDNWYAGVSVGYELNSGFRVSVLYKSGLKDVIQTQPNTCNLINVRNSMQSVSVLVGYTIEFFNHETKHIQKQWK